jgi:hypothetical protein
MLRDRVEKELTSDANVRMKVSEAHCEFVRGATERKK